MNFAFNILTRHVATDYKLSHVIVTDILLAYKKSNLCYYQISRKI